MLDLVFRRLEAGNDTSVLLGMLRLHPHPHLGTYELM